MTKLKENAGIILGTVLFGIGLVFWAIGGIVKILNS